MNEELSDAAKRRVENAAAEARSAAELSERVAAKKREIEQLRFKSVLAGFLPRNYDGGCPLVECAPEPKMCVACRFTDCAASLVREWSS